MFRNDNGNWGPEQALTPVSNSWIGYWHSDVDDDFPWIKFNMPETHEVLSVEVWDRKDCCFERFQNVEVLVDGSSCGKKSYEGQNSAYK